MILITGANGQLGQSFSHFSIQALKPSKSELNIINKDSLTEMFKESQVKIVVNCAAYTNVEACESDDTCFEVNNKGVQNLVDVCNENQATLIHISTDYVFNGKADTPYDPTDKTSPINKYGASKAAGEKYIIENSNNYIIIRTSWLYSEFGNNFVKTMLKLFQDKDEINVVADQYGSPTYAFDLAEYIVKLCEFEQLCKLKEILHFSNQGQATWFDFAQEIANQTQAQIEIHKVSSSEYKTKAERPKYSVLNTEKTHNLLATNPKPWKESLKLCLSKIS